MPGGVRHSPPGPAPSQVRDGADVPRRWSAEQPLVAVSPVGIHLGAPPELDRRPAAAGLEHHPEGAALLVKVTLQALRTGLTLNAIVKRQAVRESRTDIRCPPPHAFGLLPKCLDGHVLAT